MMKECLKRDLGRTTCIGCGALARSRRFVVQYGIFIDEAITFTSKNECPVGYSPSGSEIIENGVVTGTILEGEIIQKCRVG
jgi:hypothetical protein